MIGASLTHTFRLQLATRCIYGGRKIPAASSVSKAIYLEGTHLGFPADKTLQSNSSKKSDRCRRLPLPSSILINRSR